MLPWQQESFASLAFTPQNAFRRETVFLSTLAALAALNTATTAANDDNEVPWAKFLADKAAYVYNWWTDDSDPNTTCGADLYRDWADDVNESYSAYATASGAAYLSMATTVAAANDTYYASTPDDSVEDDDGDADDLPSVSPPDGAERWSAAMAEAESDYLDTLAAAELQLAVDTEAAGDDETALAAAQADYDAAVSAAELAYQVAAAEADGDAAVADAEAVDDYIDDVYGEDGDYDTWQSAVTDAESAYETAASSAWSGLQKNLAAHDAALESALADTYAKAMEELADDFPGNPWAARAAADARAESDKIAADQSAKSAYADSVHDANIAFDTALATADAARSESQADALRTSLLTQSEAAVTKAEDQAEADTEAAGDGVGPAAAPVVAEPEEAAQDVTTMQWANGVSVQTPPLLDPSGSYGGLESLPGHSGLVLFGDNRVSFVSEAVDPGVVEKWEAWEKKRDDAESSATPLKARVKGQPLPAPSESQATEYVYQQKTVVISFVNEWKSTSASLIMGRFCDIHIVIDTSDIFHNPVDWQGIIKRIDEQLENRHIYSVTITGHGDSAASGQITLSGLRNKNSGEYALISYLGRVMSEDARGIQLNSCMSANGDNGKAFLMLMANIADCPVTGWTDWYAITPHGDRWIAKPGKPRPEWGSFEGDYKGSFAERLNNFAHKYFD